MTSLLLIGCGKMGSALLAGWRARGMACTTVDPSQPADYSSLAALPARAFDAVVFAVKPQSLAALLPDVSARFGVAPLYISIAAGKPLSFFSAHLGTDARVVRAMPNTPVMVGKGVTALVASANVPASETALAEQLMTAVGSAVWLAEEGQMDAVTALSGSGPAYVFLFLEALTQAGAAAGLPDALAQALALDTLMGSAALAAASSESFAQLRQNVTSPGGTTEAALSVLMQDDALAALMAQAVAAAKARSLALGGVGVVG